MSLRRQMSSERLGSEPDWFEPQFSDSAKIGPFPMNRHSEPLLAAV